MTTAIVPLVILWAFCRAEDYFYQGLNLSRSSLSGIEAYRSALTLDWMAAEDQRQRELVAAFETQASPPGRVITVDCINYPRPAAGKVARLMLELLKNLEGDDGILVTELIHSLIRSKMLVETSMLDSEPDLESLVKTPGVMIGEPHVTFPRLLALLWMAVTDPVLTKKSGWCSVKKVSQYLVATKPIHIAPHVRSLDPLMARARFVMDEFIQNMMPLSVFSKPTRTITPRYKPSKNERFHTIILPRLSTAETTSPQTLVLKSRGAEQSRKSGDSKKVRTKSSAEVNALQAGTPALSICRVLVMCLLWWTF